MFKLNRDVESKPGVPGIMRKALNYSDQMMLCEFQLEKGAILPDHTHPHEQLTYVIAGCLRYTLDGETCDLGPGDTALVPSNVSHRVEVLEDSKCIDVFLPLREDYL